MQVFGGSWGSTLALAYSQSHPDKVYAFVFYYDYEDNWFLFYYVIMMSLFYYYYYYIAIITIIFSSTAKECVIYS